jgi:5'-nucleotidase
MNEPVRPLVLVSNDDGVASRGLRLLATALGEWADVVVVAPETEQSASSHALTLNRPLRARRVEESTYAVDGTPADCVYAALHAGTRFLPRGPDIVCSGINRGLNLGQDAFYSGTIAAAREAALRGIPSIAVSSHPKGDREAYAKVTSKLARALYERTRGTVKVVAGPLVATDTVLLNVNFPERWTGEIRQTRLGARLYEIGIDVRRDPRGREYMWLGGPDVRHERAAGTDTDAYDDGAASVTPLLLDLTRTAGTELATELIRRASLASEES